MNTLSLILSLTLPAVLPCQEEPASHASLEPTPPQQVILASGQVEAAWNSAQVLRTECFEFPGSDAGHPTQVVRLRHYWHAGKEHFELDRAFAAGSLFTSQSESWGASDARFVWREYGLGMGEPHTFLIDKPLGAFDVTTSRYGLGSETHRTRPGSIEGFEIFAGFGASTPRAPEEAEKHLHDLLDALGTAQATPVDWAPLKLWQAARTNAALPGELLSTHPQTANIETLHLTSVPVRDLAWLAPQDSNTVSARCVRIQSETSGEITELLLRGEDLIALRFHGRGPWAQRIAPERWSMLERDWRGIAQSSERTPRARAMEAAAPFLDKRARSNVHWWKDSDLGMR